MSILFYRLRKKCTALVILALLFNSTAPLLASTWAVNEAQQYATDDAMMICTGSTFKWISTAEYFDSGQVVFIDPPANAPTNLQSLDCSFEYISDQHTDQTNVSYQDNISIAYKATVLTRAQRPYTSFAYLTAQTRAPPLL